MSSNNKNLREFRVNEFISLKLESNKTYLYIKGQRFMQCMRLVLNIPREEFNMYDEAKSIDEASEIFKTLYENEMLERGEHFISPEQEFWGHCSNIQAWVENSYDTRLLHSNLAFSLLKKLVNIGDPLAKKGFKDEIINRLEEGNGTVVGFLIETGLLRSLSREELNDLSNSLESPLGKLAIWGIQYELPVSYYRCLDRLKHNIGLVKLGIDNNAPSSFYDRIDLLETNLELATLGVQNKAPWIFFEDFDKFKQDIEITKLGLLNRAPRSFYENYDRLKENPELAKIGVQNSAPKSFYENFDKFRYNPELAKLGIENDVPEIFFIKFHKFIRNVELIKSAIQNNAPSSYYNNFNSD